MSALRNSPIHQKDMPFRILIRGRGVGGAKGNFVRFPIKLNIQSGEEGESFKIHFFLNLNLGKCCKKLF